MDRTLSELWMEASGLLVSGGGAKLADTSTQSCLDAYAYGNFFEPLYSNGCRWHRLEPWLEMRRRLAYGTSSACILAEASASDRIPREDAIWAVFRRRVRFVVRPSASKTYAGKPSSSSSARQPLNAP